MLFAVNCSKKPENYVELVRDGYLQEYKTTTIGKAFDASFDNPQWKAFETDKGVIVVEFNGSTSQKTHENACRLVLAEHAGVMPESEFRELMDSGKLDAMWTPGVPATVQFTIGLDRESFEISHINSPAWSLMEADDVLTVIYH